MNVVNRLENLYPFDEAVVQDVELAAALQNQRTFPELADMYNLADGPSTTVIPGMAGLYQYWHLKPTGDYDETAVRVYMAPMATPTDQNLAMRTMRLFAADPSLPLFVAGAPAAVGNRNNRISPSNLPTVWRGNLQPAVAPTLHFLRSSGVQTADFIGHSYGAATAAAASAGAAEYGVTVAHGVYMEPAGVVSRGLFRLLGDFKRSEAKLQHNVEASASEPFLEARKLADTGFTRYVGGLLRLSNVAIAHAQTMPLFVPDVRTALDEQIHMHATLAWGGKSEITPTPAMERGVKYLGNMFPGQVSRMMVPEMYHAGGDDIDLHAAMVLQALRK